MTCKGKLAIEHPEKIKPRAIAGVIGCPSMYGYLERPDYCDDMDVPRNEACVKCWDRVIPEPDECSDQDIDGEQNDSEKFCRSCNNFGYYEICDECMDYESFNPVPAENTVKCNSCDNLWKEGCCDRCVNNSLYVPKGSEEAERIDEFHEKLQAAGKAFQEGITDGINNPCILDSGNRREFETGAVRDIQEGKGRCDLLPLDVADYYLYTNDPDQEGSDLVLKCIYKFQETGDTWYLLTALYSMDYHWDDGKTKDSAEDIIMQRRCTMLLEVAIHFEEGCKKYGENNWRKGIPVHCYIDSAVRHYLKYLRGDKDERHDRAFCWNIMCAIWTCKHKPELNEYALNEVK